MTIQTSLTALTLAVCAAGLCHAQTKIPPPPAQGNNSINVDITRPPVSKGPRTQVNPGVVCTNAATVSCTDTGNAVEGRANRGGAGVYGQGFGGGPGVLGDSDHNNGVEGRAGDNLHAGVAGLNNGGGLGVFGDANHNDGVKGQSHDSAHAGVSGLNDGGGIGVFGNSNTNDGLRGFSSRGNGVSAFSETNTGIYAKGPINAGFFDGNVTATGKIQTATLVITGGADVAEPFRIGTQDSPAGAVVIIDDENAGRLKLSEGAYDRRVAGILSGANGINPGVSLSQPGMGDDGQNVALSGRVYVLADATNGDIKPGDFLTTSDTPGHAMKVTDFVRAQGAVLGKAMSGLKEGRGMVLVLVTLQ